MPHLHFFLTFGQNKAPPMPRPKTILLWFVFLSLMTAGRVQAQYFSKDYSLYAGTNAYISSIQVVNDTIYAMCYVGDSLNNAIGIACFEKFDKHGNLFGWNPLSIPNCPSVTSFYNSLIKSNDGGFTYVGNTWDTILNQNAFLILKFDRYGNLQWYKELPIDNVYSLYSGALIQDSFSNYYFTGNVSPLDGTQGIYAYIAKTDSLGNMIYIKYFRNTDSFMTIEMYGLCFIKNGNIVISGGYGYFNTIDLIPDWSVSLNYEIDTAGNIIKQVYGTDSNGRGGGYITPTSDSGYICVGNYYCTRYVDHINGAGSISKLDSNFHVIWTISAGPCSLNTILWTFRPSPDGNYIAVGQWYDENDTPQIHMNGWIMKFDENGQVIWSKLYRGVTSDGPNGDNNLFYSLAFMSDSSILCAGQAANEDDPIQPSQLGWLLHLDTAGCLPDSNNCGIADGIKNVPQTNGSVKAYPNPASDHLTIEYTSDGSASTLTLYNILGQQMYSGSLPGGSGLETVNIRSWSPGLYLYRVSSPQGFEASGTFVVQ